MALITLRDLSIAYGDEPLLDRVNLTIKAGEKVCLLGRNGTGKTTLMGVIGGHLTPDQGEVVRSRGITIAGLPQEVPKDLSGRVFDVVCQNIGAKGKHLVDYRRLLNKKNSEMENAETRDKKLAKLQQTIEEENGWRIEQQVDKVLSKMKLPAEEEVQTFSAGLKRRVLTAAALVSEPDVLLLDEPTNHLDMDAIRWLEGVLAQYKGTLVMVTHDRMMIRRLANRILEIDRGRLHSWECDYQTYLKRNQERLEAEEKGERVFDKKLSAEEKWIRQGIKARRTRNEGRVRALKKLREIRRNRRDRTGKVKLSMEEAQRSGKVVAETVNLSFSFGDRRIVDNFSYTILRGDRIGILGPNGVGKSTLIRLFLGELEASAGRLKHGTNLQVLYFDQLRGQLEEEKTVHENVSPHGDMLEIGGRKRHVIGYLKDFLFSPQRSRTPVWVLSGGEKNRLLLAKLFARPSNVLVLDEPTNDLDVETLELLEELLLDYKGTVLLVSHDRTFINNVVTSTLVFEKEGKIEGYAGGYDDWLVQRPEAGREPKIRSSLEKQAQKAVASTKSKKKLSYMEQRELDALPGQIEALERRQQKLFETLSAEDFYKQPGETIASVKNELSQVESDLEKAYERWEALEAFGSSKVIITT
jgi:ATP-binding cassette subfamily F protein uup